MLAAVAAALAGCSTVTHLERPQMQERVQAKVDAAHSDTRPSFALRPGDTIEQALISLGQIDGSIYILARDKNASERIELAVPSQQIFAWDDLSAYLKAIGYRASIDGGSSEVEHIGRGGYVRVRIAKTESPIRTKASNPKCKVALHGAMPLGPAINDICNAAKVECAYGDAGAAAYAGVVYPMAYTGNCAGAIDYLSKKADLAVAFTDSRVDISMMDTATIDLGIPLRDRRLALDILADGRGGSTTPMTTTGSSTQGAGSSQAALSGGKSLVSGYQTSYFQTIRSVLESLRTPFGTWSYIPETGQVFVRDRAAAVAAVTSTLNRMAQAFQGRFEITLTLYRMTASRGLEVSGSLSRLINDRLTIAFGGNDYKVAKPTAALTYSHGSNQSVVQLLSTLGAIESLDSYTLNVQSGIPQTLKIANNTEYVRNVSTTTVGGGTAGVTSSVEQANATDGAFVSVQARQADSGKISVDFGAYINRLDGFDTTETQSSIVKSQRGFERTFDTVAVVSEGIPYVASIVTQNSRSDTQATLPGLESTGIFGALLGGKRADASANTYILVVVEARRQ